MTRHLLSVASLAALLATSCAGAPAEEATPAEDAAVAEEAAPESATRAEPGAPAAPVVATPPPATARATARPAAPAASRPAAAAEPPAPAPAAAPARAEPEPVLREVTAPVGTALSLELVSTVSTASAVVESPVTARLREDVIVDGVIVIPAGSTLYGNVTQVERPGRVRGRGSLAFRFTEAGIDGVREPLRTETLTFQSEAGTRDDATKVGVGAGIGAVVGGLLGGGSGAAKGAAIGGAAGGGAVLATRGDDLELAGGSVLDTTLASPFSVRVEER